MDKNAPIIMWFRQDLRLSDNPALTAAVKTGKPLICLYIDDQEAPGEWYWGGASKWWLHHSLTSLQKGLGRHNQNLVLRRGKPLEILNEIIEKTGADHIVWNRLYQDFAIARDKDIKQTLKDNDITVESFNSNLLFEPWEIKNKTGGFYKVYTPFSKTCFEKGDPADALPEPSPMHSVKSDIKSDHLDDWGLLPTLEWDNDFYNHWQPGEDGAHEKLEAFITEGGIDDYKEGRNFPAKPHISKLSPHLHWGEISPKQIWHRVRIFEHQQDSQKILDNTKTFLKEILWREFGYHLLYHLDDMPKKPLNDAFKDFPWNKDDNALLAWQKGQTGYPLVDAAMRELWQTGWMHNRCRMVVGSFLVKHLRIHWIEGEKWFWDCLVDADLANNSAGWQWIAGCGADAAPYFRIFNPITQSEKFDAQGDYIRTYVPELKDVPTQYLHAPWDAPKNVLQKAGVELGVNYPYPIIEHAKGRQAALDAYEKVKKS